MGRGDKRTEKGKRTRGSFGKCRDKSKLKARAIAAKAPPKKDASAEAAPEATA
ncbi:MAG: 30S ribosomal protein THX [Planctomycetes bacterium]|nr:30S ribosomal protein THX [Planctomycetota bacterium]